MFQTCSASSYIHSKGSSVLFQLVGLYFANLSIEMLRHMLYYFFKKILSSSDSSLFNINFKELTNKIFKIILSLSFQTLCLVSKLKPKEPNKSNQKKGGEKFCCL